MIMPTTTFLIVCGSLIVTMLICRVVPLFALKGRELPEPAVRALNLIPPAAFAALVANDLLSPTMFDNGILQGCLPLIVSALVLVVGYKTKSLVWCIIVGVAFYALLLFVF